eukprot:GHVU01186132.1.p1 GENE.GHVU01186132.1~~GHVU01186132.1.p1  ORF type:complete len:147 (-),score=14.76 GHVU01186132.1:524-964(-)
MSVRLLLISAVNIALLVAASGSARLRRVSEASKKIEVQQDAKERVEVVCVPIYKIRAKVKELNEDEKLVKGNSFEISRVSDQPDEALAVITPIVETEVQQVDTIRNTLIARKNEIDERLNESKKLCRSEKCSLSLPIAISVHIRCA